MIWIKRPTMIPKVACPNQQVTNKAENCLVNIIVKTLLPQRFVEAAQLAKTIAGSLKVTGSIPVSSTQETPRNEAQSIAEQGTSENGVPCFVSGEKCNEAHNEDLNCRISRQGSAKEIAPLAVELPADLAALAAIWPTLRGNIRAAILALADVKP